MYLHLGQDIIVNKKDIIGIFDLDTATVAKNTREYLAEKEKKGGVVTVSYELPKSFIVCCNENNGETVYISQLSAATLQKRSGEIF